MAGASRPKTRSVTDYWMVGQENPVLPVGVLPTHRDILKEVLYKRSLPENKSLDQLSLSLVSSNFQIQMLQRDAPIILTTRSVLFSRQSGDINQEAGTKTINDRSIAEKIVELYNDYQAIKKKSETSKGAVEARNSFEAFLDTIFNVMRPDAEDLIRADSSRSRQRNEEYLAFLQNQKKERKQRMSSIDQKHVKIMQNKEEREAREAAQVR